MKLVNDIGIFENALPDYYVKTLLDLAETCDFRVGFGERYEYEMDGNSALIMPFINQYYDTYHMGGVENVKQDLCLLGSTLAKYNNGVTLGLHYDGPLTMPGTVRLATCMVYLNRCQGGETLFPNQEMRIKPMESKLIVFPASYTHPHYTEPTDHKLVLVSSVGFKQEK